MKVSAGLLLLLLLADPTSARTLDERIPNLFGGFLITSISPRDANDAQRPLVAERFRGLSAALAVARSQAPAPSASGAFRFAWDPEVDTFVRFDQSLGPSLAERAPTLGKGTMTVSVSYTGVDFDTLEGDSLGHITSVQPALSDDFLALLPPGDRMRAQDNTLETRIDFDFRFDLAFFTFALGLTDHVDFSLAFSVNHARMRARAQSTIFDPNGDQGAYFTVDQKGVIVGGSGNVCARDYRCASDAFTDEAFGVGDIYLRGKWHFASSEWADLAAAAVLTLPTGNADELLGFHDPTFTPWVIVSRSFGRFSPHLNFGYGVRSGEDVSQAQWIAGADVLATGWLTASADFLGYHDDHRDGVNDDVLQAALGVKFNPWNQFVLSGTVQLPLNRDGLRADVIYTGQFEYTF